MKEVRCVIVGGGHTGIHTAKSIRQAFRENGIPVQMTLMDKRPYHVRKVLLFIPAVEDKDITVPWDRILPDDIQFVQGVASELDSEKKHLRYRDDKDNEHRIDYDILVIAAGSVVRRPQAEQGGLALTGLGAAKRIRERWSANLRKAANESSPKERERLMTAAVAGAGISGIETAAELALRMRQEAEGLGMNPGMVRTVLINAQDRLFQEGPSKVGRRLEQMLADYGVTVVHKRKVLQEKSGELVMEDGSILPVGMCIWTLGLSPNPMLSEMGLPLSAQGQVVVDPCYRVKGMPGVYSIGDCANVVDPSTGFADRMTCKEGIMQAIRLGKIAVADCEGRPAPTHAGVLDFFCIGLGPI